MWIGSIWEPRGHHNWLHHHRIYQHGVSTKYRMGLDLLFRPKFLLFCFYFSKKYNQFSRAVERSNCFHRHGHEAKCQPSNYPFMIIFACIQIVLSQIPDFDKLSWLSILAAVMSFAYSSIGVGLSIAKVVGRENLCTSERRLGNS